MSKHVLVLNQMALPRDSAGGTRHVELFGRIDGWNAQILAGNKTYLDQSPVESSGILKAVRVTRFKGNGASRIINWASYSAASLARGITGPKPDVVYGSSPHMGAALAGWMISKVRRAGFVLEVRDLWPHILAESGMMSETSLIYSSLKRLERFLYRRADRIVILAEGTASYIVAEGIDPELIVFIPNGADTSDFEVDENRQELRSEFGFNDFTIVYAGAHGPANGLELVLNAAERLGPEAGVTFALVGDGVIKQDLVEAAHSRELQNVRFMEPIPKDQIPRLFAACDAGLHCLADHALFKKGVSPNKLYDYMAAGLPVITNTGGDVAALVEAAGSGVWTEPDQIANGVRLLANSTPDQLNRQASNGKCYMEAHRSRRATADLVKQTLEAAVR